MSFYGHAFHKVFIGTGAVRTTGKPENLISGEIGLFDPKTWNALSLLDVSNLSHREVLVGQGSWHTKDSLTPFIGGMKMPNYSRKINGRYVSKFYVDYPTRSKAAVWTVGYNGVSDCQPITGDCDTTYTIRVEVKGSPAFRYMNHSVYHDFSVHTGCCTDCDTGDCSTTVDPQMIADDLVRQINSEPNMKHFVKAEKIMSCTPDYTDPTAVAWEYYEVNVADDGSQVALARLQQTYPTQTITRVARNGITSTYRFAQIATAGAPSAYTIPGQSVIANCDTCPSGWTTVASSYKYVYKIEEVLSSASPTSPTVAPTFDTNVSTPTVAGYTFLGHEGGVSTYYAYIDVPIAAVTAAVSNKQELVNTFEKIPTICTLASGQTATWTLSTLAPYKVSRTLCITLPKECGSGSSKLTAVQAMLATHPQVVTGSIAVETNGDCAEVITLKQYSSNLLIDGCAGYDVATYDDLQSFEGHAWAECPCQDVPDVLDCQVGIRLTAAYEDTKFGNCSFQPTDHFEVEPLQLVVTMVKKDGEICNEPNWAITELQVGKQGTGYGESILREYIDSLGYKKERWETDPRMREILDYTAMEVVDRNKMYKRYGIIHSIPFAEQSRTRWNQEVYVLNFIFPEEVDTTAFERLMGTYLATHNVFLETFQA